MCVWEMNLFIWHWSFSVWIGEREIIVARWKNTLGGAWENIIGGKFQKKQKEEIYKLGATVLIDCPQSLEWKKRFRSVRAARGHFNFNISSWNIFVFWGNWVRKSEWAVTKKKQKNVVHLSFLECGPAHHDFFLGGGLRPPKVENKTAAPQKCATSQVGRRMNASEWGAQNELSRKREAFSSEDFTKQWPRRILFCWAANPQKKL